MTRVWVGWEVYNEFSPTCVEIGISPRRLAQEGYEVNLNVEINQMHDLLCAYDLGV